MREMWIALPGAGAHLAALATLHDDLWTACQ
jgi:hypothetical protein